MPALPLEFVDCVVDGPYFRENLVDHEKQIDVVNKDLKSTINLVTKYIDAFKRKYCSVIFTIFLSMVVIIFILSFSCL